MIRWKAFKMLAFAALAVVLMVGNGLYRLAEKVAVKEESAETRQAALVAERSQAVETLQAEAFLPHHVAACVVDRIEASTAWFYPADGSRDWLSQNPDVLAQCSEVDECPRSANSLAEPTGAKFIASFQWNPGRVSAGSNTFDGTEVDYLAITPTGFVPGDTAPVLLALPESGEGLVTPEQLANEVYIEAIDRGWVVVSPLNLPGADGRVDDFLPEFVDWMKHWVTPEGDLPHLAGLGDAGSRAFDAAAAHPGAFRSLMAYPGSLGLARDDQALRELCSVPVRIWVGSQDDERAAAEATRDALADRGGDVQLTIVEGQDRSVLVGQGARLFDALDAARSG